MTGARQGAGALKGRALRGIGARAARWKRRRTHEYRPGVTIVTVNWNSLPFLRVMLDATRAMSPPDTEILVADNGSTDASAEYLATRGDARLLRLPVNVGHGVALDLAVATVETEHVAVLDVDAFPVSPTWLAEALGTLQGDAMIAGAHLHRNFVHPCFFVAPTKMLHDYDLTFQPVGSLSRLADQAPLFLDVGEALAQRVIVKFGGGQAMHLFEITEARGPGPAGAVFGGLVYHNMFATQGSGNRDSLDHWYEAARRFHPTLELPSGGPDR